MELGKDGEPYFALRCGNGGAHNMLAITGQQLYSIMPMNSGTDYKARAVEVAQPIMTAPTGGNQGGDYVVEPTAFHATQDPISGDVAPAQGANSYIGVHERTIVRRLTELECERLQGYPDGWTDGQPGSTRYRQLGNSVAVPCVEWIARRLVAVDRDIHHG